MMNYIYIIQNSINEKFYVGRTNNPSQRKRAHFSELRRGVHGNPRLQNAFNKYGERAFTFSIVDTAIADQIEAKEAEWFSAFDQNKDYLYNCHFKTYGGPEIWKPHTAESKLKISESIKNGTRKYIFDVLDEGFKTKVGLNTLARKHSVGATTLMTYKPEWEILRGVKYGHPQVDASIERMKLFAEAYKQRGVDVMRNLKEFGISLQTVWEHCEDFGISRKDTRLDAWKEESRQRAFSAYEYKAKTNCTAQEAIRHSGATTATFYKYLDEWKLQTGAAMSSKDRAEKVVQMVTDKVTHMHGACKEWRIGRDTVKKYFPEMFIA